MPYEHLLVERQGPVGWLINNRPEQLNAMNGAMREEFGEAWIELDRDPDVRVIVHTGEGRAFQTGVDVWRGSLHLPTIQVDMTLAWLSDGTAAVSEFGPDGCLVTATVMSLAQWSTIIAALHH